MRSAPAGSRSSRGFSQTKSCARPSRHCGGTSRGPRSTSPIRPAIPVTPVTSSAAWRKSPYRSWDLNRLAFHPDLVDRGGALSGHRGSAPLQSGAVGQVRRRGRLRPAAPPGLRQSRPGGPRGRPVPATDHVHLPLRRHRAGRSHPDRPLPNWAGMFRSPRSTSNSVRWPIARCRSSGPPGASSSTGPTSSTGDRTSRETRSSRFSILADFQARGTTSTATVTRARRGPGLRDGWRPPPRWPGADHRPTRPWPCPPSQPSSSR